MPCLPTLALLVGKSGANLRRIVDVNHIQRKALVSTSAFTLSAYLDIQHTNIVITRRATECAGLWIETQPARQRFAICQASAVGQFVVLVGGVECILRKGISQLFLFMNALRRQRFASGWRLRLFRLRFGIRLRIRFGLVVVMQRRQFKPKEFLTVKETIEYRPALGARSCISYHKIVAGSLQFERIIIGVPFRFRDGVNSIGGNRLPTIEDFTLSITVSNSRRS